MAKENDKFKPLTRTQGEWDAIPPHVWDGKIIDDDFPDFAELFVDNLNENSRENTAEEQVRQKHKCHEAKK